VYLDLNHWIYLAQAATGHARGRRYREALDALRQAAGRVVIPLASVHYMEMEGNRNAAQRADVANVMEELSGFVCVMPRSSILRVEIDAALAQIVGTPNRVGNAPLLGWGVPSCVHGRLLPATTRTKWHHTRGFSSRMVENGAASDPSHKANQAATPKSRHIAT
jgi:hypothetical protein